MSQESLNKPPALNLLGLLKQLKRPVKIVGMEGEFAEDPVAQEIIFHREDIAALELFLINAGIQKIQILEGAYGFSAAVLDAGENVIRTSTTPPTAKPDIPQVLQPHESAKIGSLFVQVIPKVETSSVTEEDAALMKEQLNLLGYQWDDAGPDNLGRKKDGTLTVIDGSVTKKEN